MACWTTANMHSTTPLPTSPLRRLRVRSGLTQLALSIRAECSLNSISIAERGGRLSVEMAERLARALHCEPRELMDAGIGGAGGGR